MSKPQKLRGYRKGEALTEDPFGSLGPPVFPIPLFGMKVLLEECGS